MKLSIRENLSKFNLINEGWEESLSNKYGQDMLIFVGIMLERAFGDEDFSNQTMALWIAKSTKGFLRGKSMPLEEPHKTTIEESFQEILNFIKNSDNPEETVREIVKMNPQDALELIKNPKEDSSPDVTQTLLDNGVIRIEKELNDGRIWVEVLN
jgi:hypothetical protein